MLPSGRLKIAMYLRAELDKDSNVFRLQACLLHHV